MTQISAEVTLMATVAGTGSVALDWEILSVETVLKAIWKFLYLPGVA